MAIQQQPVVEQSIFGALSDTVKTACSVAQNGMKMVDNAFIAGERITYIAASKATNLAVISDTADTLKLLVAQDQLDSAMDKAGYTFDANGNMVKVNP